MSCLSIRTKTVKVISRRAGRFILTGSQHFLMMRDVRQLIQFKDASFFEKMIKLLAGRIGKAFDYSSLANDVGLLSFLLGIREADQISRDPLVGQVFENLVVIECLKSRYNRGLLPDLYYFHDSKRNEVDLLAQSGRFLKAMEIKSASTFSMKRFQGIRRFNSITDRVESSYLIYSGEDHQLSGDVSAIPYTKVDSII